MSGFVYVVARTMGRRLALLFLAAMSGCTCGHKTDATTNGGPAATGVDLGLGPNVARDGGATDARFSAPIDAVHSVGGAVYIAGLVVPAHAIEVSKIGADGKVVWTRTVIDEVAWSADAELDVRALGAGLVVTWDGPRAGARGGRIAQMVDENGEKHGEPFRVWGSICTTRTEVVWPENGTFGTRVLARSWDGVAHEVGRLVPDREPSITCSRTSIFGVGEGDDDVTLANDGTAAPLKVLAATDFPSDEERDHQMYGFGDRLGVVRVAASGAIALRDVQGTPPSASPWRTTPFHLEVADDLVAVDGDARATYLVTTHDEDPSACDGSESSSVHVVAFSNAKDDAGKETSVVQDLVLAPPDCTHELGPFWTDSLGDDMTIAWAVRASRRDKTTAPIASLDFRTVGPDGVRKKGSLAANADSLVDAGCDGTRCYAVALVRAPGTDVMLPESAKVLLYP